jgi:hypothetical protein
MVTAKVLAEENVPAPRRSLVGAMRLLLIASVSAISATALYEVTSGRIQVPTKVRDRAESAGATDADMQLFRQSSKRVEWKRSGLAYGFMGLLLGFVVSANSFRTYSLIFRNRVAVALTALFGFVSGGIGGSIASLMVQEWLSGPPNLAEKAMFSQGVAWSITGLGVGLSMYLTSREKPAFQSILVLAVCGVLAAILFIPVAALVVPTSKVDQLVPRELVSRMLWAHIGAVSILFGAASQFSHALAHATKPTSQAAL